MLDSSTSAIDLIRACAESDDSAAWVEFVARFQRPISLSIVRTAYQWGMIPRQVVDDLVQETYLKLCADKCRLLLNFAVQHPDAIPGYIKTIAVNLAHDHFKAHYSQKRGAGLAPESLEDMDPKAESGSLGGPKAMERQVLLKQIDDFLKSCSIGPHQERDQFIFWLYYQQGMSAKAIAGLPTVRLTDKGIEAALSRLVRCIRGKLGEALG